MNQNYDAAWEHMESIYGARDLLLTLSRKTSPDVSHCVMEIQMGNWH